jgi:hypothetical protein
MAVPAFIRLSDSGVPLDSGLRRVLEESFSVDLSGVRLHAGPRTAAFLRLHGYPAAAAGHRVFMPAARRGDGERWLYVLVHEIAHVASEVAAFRAYGDENMLRHGAAISAVTEAIAASRTAISDIITSGRSMTQPGEILRHVPTGFTDPSGRVTPLLDWHQGDALKAEAERLFASGSAMIAGAASPTMGIVSADDKAAQG